MKHIKLFEQFEYDDPFGEEINNKIKDSIYCRIIRHTWSVFSSKNYLAQSITNGHITFYKNLNTLFNIDKYDIIDPNNVSPEEIIVVFDRYDELGRSEFTSTTTEGYWKYIKYKNLPQGIKDQLK